MRKIKGIIMIIAIFTLMAHDIIPHHHHSAGSYLSTDLCFEKGHEHSSDDHHCEEPERDKPDCPGCSSIRELIVTIPDLVQNIPSRELTRRQIPGAQAIIETLVSAPSGISYLSETIFLPDYDEYSDSVLRGPNGKRGPPMI